MVHDDEFEHIVRNSQRVLKLNDQYKNHPFVEQFTKECNVMFFYGSKIDAKFHLGDIWNLFQGDNLPNNVSNFCRQMINCMRVWNYLQKTLDLPLNTEIIRQAHKIMMEDEKDVLAGDIESHLCLQVIIFLYQLVVLKDTWRTQFLGSMKPRRTI